MVIAYSTKREISSSQLLELYKDSGLKRPNNLERIEIMIKYSNLIVTAWDGEKLVGVARSITDYSWSCYLADLAVAKEYQKQGLGKRLVQITKEVIGSETMLLLLSVPTAMTYYPKIGFEKIDYAFSIPRKL